MTHSTYCQIVCPASSKGSHELKKEWDWTKLNPLSGSLWPRSYMKLTYSFFSLRGKLSFNVIITKCLSTLTEKEVLLIVTYKFPLSVGLHRCSSHRDSLCHHSVKLRYDFHYEWSRSWLVRQKSTCALRASAELPPTHAPMKVMGFAEARVTLSPAVVSRNRSVSHTSRLHTQPGSDSEGKQVSLNFPLKRSCESVQKENWKKVFLLLNLYLQSYC